MTTTPRAFSLIELLVSIAIIAMLTGILLPSLAAARDSARTARCLSSNRQLAIGWTLYAGDFDDRAMPLAYFETQDIAAGPLRYWFGSIATTKSTAPRVTHDTGFIAPYLDAAAGEASFFECPSQPWGTYASQANLDEPTTTYGYNGYYLSPNKTPGWGGAWGSIGHRPWQRLSSIERPSMLLTFADTLLPVGSTGRSVALLDPPQLYQGAWGWAKNPTPTTAFRHTGRTAAAHADASAATHAPDKNATFIHRHNVGSVTETNTPRYVPDADRW